MQTVKGLIRLDECTGWSKSSLDAPVMRFILSCCGSFGFPLAFDAVYHKCPTISNTEFHIFCFCLNFDFYAIVS